MNKEIEQIKFMYREAFKTEGGKKVLADLEEIGRASCRERV